MQKTCANTWCNQQFEIYLEEKELLQKFDVPEPSLCPDCRAQRRANFAPTLVLHERTSSMSGKPILSAYGPLCPAPVYSIEEWWSDKWDALDHGRDYDENRPFLQQIEELYKTVPKMASFNENCENSEYCVGAGRAKNAYYSIRVYRSEDVYYSEATTAYNTNLCDCLRCQKSSYLYECVQCFDCHLSSYLLRSSGTKDCHFCIDMHGCDNCIFCSNQRNKSYCIFNQQLTKEEYEKRKTEIIDGKYSTLQKNLETFGDVYAKTIWKDLNNLNCEDCRGDALVNSADCFECYNSANLHQCRYCIDMSPSEKTTTVMDCTQGGIGEMLYNSTGLGGGNYFMRMCVKCRLSSDLTYCIDCYSTKKSFGSTGLRNKQYCILNKQYSEDEYKDLTVKITEKMKSDGEWGEFFPVSMSSFPYNQSLAEQVFPLTKEETETRGFVWMDQEAKQYSEEEEKNIPDGIEETDDSICSKVVSCTQSGKKFKITPQELQMYQILKQPLPRLHPDVRMDRRRKMLSPYKLWERECSKCQKKVLSSYATDRLEIVYCEECYLAEVY